MTIKIEENLFKELAFCSSILIMKMLLMAILPARQYFWKEVFPNSKKVQGKLQEAVSDDPVVGRVRRAHQNDLENILPWFVITWIWLSTGPSYYLAKILMRVFITARITHTLVYVVFSLQPHRALSFFVGYLITLYEAIVTIIYYI